MLETARLRLDLPVMEHAPLMGIAYKNSQKELQNWMVWAQHELTKEDAEDFITKQIEHETDITFFPVIKDTSQFVGSFTLMLDRESTKAYEIGYWVDSTLTGNGYATEVVNELVKYAFDELDSKRLFIRIETQNEASKKVAKKCGFKYEGITRNGASHWGESGTVDLEVYSLVPTDIKG